MIKRLILACGALLVCTAPLSAQIAMQPIVNSPTPISYVNSWANSSTSTTSPGLAVTVATITGDTVCVGVGIRTNPAPVPSSVTDSGGSTYTLVNDFVNSGNEAEYLYCSGAGSAKASTTLTVNIANGTDLIATVGDYHGVATLGSNATTDNGGGGTSTLSISLSTDTHQNNEWVIAAMITPASNATFTAGSGNLRIYKSDGSNVTAGLIDNKSTAAASVTDTIDSNGGAHSYSAVAVVLRPN